MKDNYAKLLLQLQKNPNGVGGKVLAQKLNVSTRSIRNYIRDLNNNYLSEGTIASDTRGYYLEGNIKNLHETDELIFEQRAFFIVKALLNSTDFISYETLAESLHYSVQTIRNDIYRIQELIASENRQVAIEAVIFKGVSLTGKELECRLLLDGLLDLKLLTEEQLILDLSFYFKGWLSSEELQKLVIEIKKYFKKQKVNLSLSLLKSILVYLTIAIHRSNDGHFLPELIEKGNDVNSRVYELSQALYEQATKAFNKTAVNTTNEVLGLYCFLISQEFNSEIPETAMDSKLNQQIRSWVKSVLEEMASLYHRRFNEDAKLVTDLVLHIARDILPLEFNFYIENAYLHHIKTDYVIAYQYGVTFADKFKKISELRIQENEIGYIALHFAAYIERHHSRDLNVAIVHGVHAISGSLLANRIESTFQNLQVQQILDVHHLEDLRDVAMIIASDQLNFTAEVPIVYVKDFMDAQDIDRINTAINKITMDNILNESVLIHSDSKSKTDIIKTLLQTLNRSELLDSVLQREQLSSTDTGSFAAIPHPLTIEQEKPSVLGIAVLDKPIDWGTQQVSLVVLVLPNINKHQDYDQIFGLLQKVVSQDDNQQRLSELTTAQDLIKLI